jgi:hypothetical protein
VSKKLGKVGGGQSRTKIGPASEKPAEGKPTAKDSKVRAEPSNTPKRLKGFNRPEVANLEFAHRLSQGEYATDARPSKAEDLALLSAALSAVKRGEQAGHTVAVITGQLQRVRASKENFALLWPSLRTIREDTVNRYFLKGSLKHRIRFVGDKFSLVSKHTVHNNTSLPDTCVSEKQKSEYFTALSGDQVLALCPFHSVTDGELPPVANGDLVQDFIRGRMRDYSKLLGWVHAHGPKGTIVLYWVPFPLTGLTWAEGSDDEDDMVTSVRAKSRSPRLKKKRRRLPSIDEDGEDA